MCVRARAHAHAHFAITPIHTCIAHGIMWKKTSVSVPVMVEMHLPRKERGGTSVVNESGA